jgi:hypothetical protein
MLLAKKHGAETTNRSVWFLALVIAVITSIDCVLFFGLVNMLSVEQLILLSFSAAILAAGLLITVAELTGHTKRDV